MKLWTREEVLKAVRENDILLIRFLYVDCDGVTRGYTCHRDQLEGDMSSGHAFAACMPFFSSLDTLVSGTRFGCVGEIRAVPDPATFHVLPYARRQAAMICDFVDTRHQPVGVCPRTTLKEVLAGCEYEVRASFENEFYYMLRTDTGYEPFDRSVCFSTSGMKTTENVVLDTVEALSAQGLVVEKYYPEYGPGQQEVIIKYDSGLRAADNQVIFKETVRGVAADHGIVASFMPKPFAGLAGSGSHLHVSLWKDGRNLFHDPADPVGISPLARSFIAGVLHHLPALLPFTAACVTSYKRIVPHNWASAYACYGPDNREAAVRVVSGQKGREAETTNLEFKPVDGSANPYLALAVVLAAGLDGITRGLDPGEPTMQDPHDLSPEERARRGIRRLPQHLGEAVAELERDDLLRRVLGPVMYEEYVLLKRFQWEEYLKQVTEWEVRHFAELF
ncbi:MAG TPA: glutamine synthetase [Firmicutes bacterium]|nr:glutamine synthetase [Bacillota bacterium]